MSGGFEKFRVFDVGDFVFAGSIQAGDSCESECCRRHNPAAHMRSQICHGFRYRAHLLNPKGRGQIVSTTSSNWSNGSSCKFRLMTEVTLRLRMWIAKGVDLENGTFANIDSDGNRRKDAWCLPAGSMLKSGAQQSQFDPIRSQKKEWKN